MEIKPEHQIRLNDALERGDDAFWAVIGEVFPEAKTGDFDPGLTFARDYHNSEDVKWWLRFNAPELMTGEDVPKPAWSYRDQVPSSGKYRDVVLDTSRKARGDVDWQYEQGLITWQELENALRIIEVEFA